ncbi:MAG TPA: hypothetical protein VNF47_04580 [Streptosporangiaceae bacterium]|nr:hypothetical protein [Streptosporangiaceae bacterium]
MARMPRGYLRSRVTAAVVRDRQRVSDRDRERARQQRQGQGRQLPVQRGRPAVPPRARPPVPVPPAESQEGDVSG